MLLLVLSAGVLGRAPAHADFIDTPPAGDYSYAQRALCYEVQGEMADSPLWVAWVDDAAANWNAVSAQTGWSFRKCAAGEKPNVRILFGIPETPGDSAGTHFGGDGDCQIGIVENVGGKTINKVVVGSGIDGKGWRMSDETGVALDPVNVVMHEMTHCMRLSHGNAGANTSNYEEPFAPGRHGPRTPSAKDIAALKTSATAGKPAATVTYSPPRCVNDEDDRAAIKAKLEALLKTEEAALKAVDDSLHLPRGDRTDADILKLYADGKQATSNIEAIQTMLARLSALPVCAARLPNSSGGHAELSGDASPNREVAVLNELNAARANPHGYADGLRRYETYFHGKQVNEPGRPVATTIEGVAAVDNAIAYLDHHAPVAPLTWSDPLSKAARRLADDIGPKGGFGHVGSDGSTMRQRDQAVGVWAGAMEEDISLAQKTAHDVVRQLIIDDGVPTRGHRTVVFDPGLTMAGAACGPHAVYGAICVVDFAGGLMSAPGADAAAAGAF